MRKRNIRQRIGEEIITGECTIEVNLMQDTPKATSFTNRVLIGCNNGSCALATATNQAAMVGSELPCIRSTHPIRRDDEAK